MSGFLSQILRSTFSILVNTAEIYIGSALVKKAKERLVGLIALYALLTVLSLAVVTFFFIFLYRWLSVRVNGEYAAAILCGASLFVIIAILIWRKLSQRRRKIPERRAIGGLVETLASVLEAQDPNLEAGLALGRRLRDKLKNVTPELVIAAVLVGLIIGVRPEVLGSFHREDPESKKTGQ